MKPQQAPYFNIQEKSVIAIAGNKQGNRPANLLDLISNPPALLYSSPSAGMILCLVCAASLIFQSFRSSIAGMFTSTGQLIAAKM